MRIKVLAIIILFICVGFGQADVIFDMGWDNDPLGKVSDLQFTADSTGAIGVDAWDGFFGGGSDTPTVLDTSSAETLSGTNAVDFSGVTGGVVLRDEMAYSSLNGLYGGRTGSTPSPYFVIGAAEIWTIEALVRVSQGTTVTGSIIANNSTAAEGEWWWRVTSSGDLQFRFDDGTDVVTATHSVNNGVNDGLWHHVALIFQRDAVTVSDVTVRTYVDGLQVGTDTRP